MLGEALMVLQLLTATFAQARPVDVGGRAQDTLEHSAGLYTALFYGAILLLALAFACWAILLLSRRYTERLRRKPTQPTSVPDVWSMHKPPDDADIGLAHEQDEKPDDES